MNDAPTPVWSLRQYLFRDKNFERRVDGDVVLAERANQLYRDTNYSDLITFEEDIARIAALVFLITESAGSLAELGAFASLKAVRKNLAILIQTEHEAAESFVRYGPVKRLMDEDNRRVGVYPWRTNKKGHIVKSVAGRHAASMIKFVNSLMKRVPKEELYRTAEPLQPFANVLWVLYLAQAIPITELISYMTELSGMEQWELRNKLYCMQLAGWVGTYSYENKVYWFSTADSDPFSRYAFKPGVERDTARRKAAVVASIKDNLKVPKHVREVVLGKKIDAAA
jgi:hypothetical protein